MKTFILFALAVAAVSARSADPINWDNVRPIEHYPKFWDDKPAELRPPQSFFDQVEREGRIVGGQIAEQHQFPYQAGILTFLPSIGGQALCGGTLLSATRVLTAAHCVDGGTSGTVILGAHNITNPNEPNQRRISFGVSEIVMHESWDPSLIRDDVALVRLPTAATLNEFIRPARLPTTAELNDSFNGENGVVSGWGVFSDAEGRSSDVLRYVYDNIITNTACTLRFPGIIQPSNICVTGTNGRGACSGDSGGPLTVQRGPTGQEESVVIGVVSFGLALGCERAWPSVFARVTSYNSWILQRL